MYSSNSRNQFPSCVNSGVWLSLSAKGRFVRSLAASVHPSRAEHLFAGQNSQIEPFNPNVGYTQSAEGTACIGPLSHFAQALQQLRLCAAASCWPAVAGFDQPCQSQGFSVAGRFGDDDVDPLVPGRIQATGAVGADTLASTDIDSIDLSELGEDMLAHSYFANDKSALADMVTLFWRDADPDRRCGLEKTPETAAGVGIWQYKQGTCATEGLINAIAHLRQAKVETVPEALTALSEAAKDPFVRSKLEPVIARILE